MKFVDRFVNSPVAGSVDRQVGADGRQRDGQALELPHVRVGLVKHVDRLVERRILQSQQHFAAGQLREDDPGGVTERFSTPQRLAHVVDRLISLVHAQRRRHDEVDQNRRVADGLERVRVLEFLSEAPSALLVAAGARLDGTKKRVCRDKFDYRYVRRKCVYRIDNLERGIEFAICESYKCHRIEDDAYGLGIAVNVTDHILQLRRQRSSIGNAVVVDGERKDESGGGNRQGRQITSLRCQVTKLAVTLVDVCITAYVERRRNQHGAWRDSHGDDVVVVIG